MKQLICLFLCLLLCLPLFACGKTAGTETPTESSPESRTETGTESGTKAPAESGTETGTETEPSSAPDYAHTVNLRFGTSGNMSSAPDYAHTRTPMMGWASWNLYHTAISEEKILAAANALKELGLADLGYTYVNIDDGFQRGRDEDGTLIVHPERFPNGMKSVADRIHEMGLYAGIYTDAGVMTCGYLYSGETANGEVGLYGHEEKTVTVRRDEIGYASVTGVTDLWTDEALSPGESFTVTLAPHETAVLRVNGTRNDAGNTRVDLVIDEDPWLFDLTALGVTDRVLPGYVSGYVGVRNMVILTYCPRANRSLQAYLLLRYLGYENVYWIGSTDPNEG